MTENPATETRSDFVKALAGFDPAKMMDEFVQTVERSQLPSLDANALMEGHRRNVGALAQANRQILEGVQALIGRQQDMFKQILEETVATLKGTSVTPSATGLPKNTRLPKKQTELLRRAIEKALMNMRELAAIAAKANTETLDTIQNRVEESLDEIRELLHKTKR